MLVVRRLLTMPFCRPRKRNSQRILSGKWTRTTPVGLKWSCHGNQKVAHDHFHYHYHYHRRQHPFGTKTNTAALDVLGSLLVSAATLSHLLHYRDRPFYSANRTPAGERRHKRTLRCQKKLDDGHPTGTLPACQTSSVNSTWALCWYDCCYIRRRF